jgi:sugar phosphate isomerase/epimerase
MTAHWTSRLSVAEVSTFRWSFEEDVFRYRSHGFKAMGIWRMKLADYGEAKAAEFLNEQGIQVSSLNWAGGFTGNDGRSFRDALHDALDAIECAAMLKADSLVILSGGRSGHTRNHAKRLLMQALKELSEAARAVGVQLAVEPMHIGCAQDFTFLTSIPDTLDIVAKLGQTNLGIVFDSYHLTHDEDVLNWLPALAPMIKLVQLGDAKSVPTGEQNRCMFGEGNLPVSTVVQTMESCGYQGYYEVELVGEDVEHYGYDRLLKESFERLQSIP